MWYFPRRERNFPWKQAIENFGKIFSLTKFILLYTRTSTALFHRRISSVQFSFVLQCILLEEFFDIILAKVTRAREMLNYSIIIVKRYLPYVIRFAEYHSGLCITTRTNIAQSCSTTITFQTWIMPISI